MRAQVGKFTLSGDGLCIGCDSGDNVSQGIQVTRDVYRRYDLGCRSERRQGAVHRSRDSGGGSVRRGV